MRGKESESERERERERDRIDTEKEGKMGYLVDSFDVIS